ncbi:uncharacterized protein LOC142349017 [Convolutriloba macropyga]|uniref:uncharacterized protein LOC142349017 n=1 Tax=Convolutriloba macropyga TaxID=536237 RepID=UPI003F521D71
MIRDKYQQLNWYSTANLDLESGGCCVRQSSQYIQNGQRKGLSPEQYLAQASNYSSHNKHLMYITTRFEPSICKNIITGLGFGSRIFDHVRFIGAMDTSIGFIFPPSLSSHSRGRYDEMMPIRTFTEESLERILTFDWFKTNVICKDQSWICETDWSQELE